MFRRLPKTTRTMLVYLVISFAVSVFVFVLTQNILIPFPPLSRAEASLIDLRFQLRGARPRAVDSADVIIVEISQESFRSLPERWPWPRSYYTHLVRNLKRAGAKAVGLDIVFSTPDVRDTLADVEFKKEIRESGGVVLAGKLDPDRRLYTIHSTEENYGDIFIDSSARFGIVNIRTDADGVLRRYMPFTVDSLQRIPTFSFAVLNAFFNRPRFQTAATTEGSFRFEGRWIPRFDASSFLINFYGPSGTFRRIRFEDVIDDKEFVTVEERKYHKEINTFDDPDYGYLYDGTFSGKIVIVGSTVPEEKDLFPVAIGEGRSEGDNQMYGVEIHANIIQNILDGDFIIREPGWMSAALVLGISLFTFVYTAALKTIRTKFSALIEILGAGIIVSELFFIYWFSIRLFVQHGFLVEMMSPLMAVVFSYMGSTIYNYVSERKQKVQIKGMFSQYVNPTIVDEIVNNPEKLRLGGERKELTVMFSDIEKFTSLSEKLPPEDLVAILNEYLSMMTEIILSNEGTLDKYEGDAIVAFWGAPVPQLDHALRACRAAVEMQDKIAEIRPAWVREGKPNLNVRIGINTGEMIVGNMGGIGHFDYTVIGDSVNIGARLEGANKQYCTNVIVSEGTYRQVGSDAVVRELDMLVVAGRTEPIRVYELVGMANGSIAPERLNFVENYTKALACYRRRQWTTAIELFERASEIFPLDFPTQMYIGRSQLYLTSPPPDDWNGTFVLRTK